MKPRDHLLLAFRNLAHRRLRSWLTMIGIFIGIAAVVSLIGLGEGLRSSITGQFGFLGSDVLSVSARGVEFAGPPGLAVARPLTDDLTEEITKIDNVEVAINRYLVSGTLEFNDQQTIGLAASVPFGDKRKIFEEMVNLKIESGRLLKDGDKRKVVLGNNFKEPDILGKGIVVGDKILLNDIKYEVIGILEKKGSFIFDFGVFVNEDVLLEDFKNPNDNSVNVIAVKVRDESKINQVQEDIEKLLRKERNVKEGEEDFLVESPQALLDNLNDILFGVQLFVTIIAVISLLVGGIGIMNTMYTSVLERTKEIGIMKSIGAKNSNIFSMFFIESGFLGLVGGIIGILLGLGLAFGLAFIGRQALGGELIQAQVSSFLIIGSLLFSFVLGTFFGTLPAYRASRLKPVESLRGEV